MIKLSFDYIIDNEGAEYFADRYSKLYPEISREKIYDLAFVANDVSLSESTDEALEKLLDFEIKQSIPSLLNMLFEGD